jgi:hypothetical protein
MSKTLRLLKVIQKHISTDQIQLAQRGPLHHLQGIPHRKLRKIKNQGNMKAANHIRILTKEPPLERSLEKTPKIPGSKVSKKTKKTQKIHHQE